VHDGRIDNTPTRRCVRDNDDMMRVQYVYLYIYSMYEQCYDNVIWSSVRETFSPGDEKRIQQYNMSLLQKYRGVKILVGIHCVYNVGTRSGSHAIDRWRTADK